MLLKHGADINIAGSVGDRPLHLACGKGYVRVTQLLVEGTSKQKADGKGFWYYSVGLVYRNHPLHFSIHISC